MSHNHYDIRTVQNQHFSNTYRGDSPRIIRAFHKIHEMYSLRLLLLVAFVSYGTQRVESIKPLTFLKTLIEKHLKPLGEQTTLVDDGGQQYAVYKCDVVYDDADVQCTDHVEVPNGNPMVIEVGQAGIGKNAGGKVETDADVETIVVNEPTVVGVEKEYEKVYPQDPNTEWLLGSVTPVENWPTHPAIDDAKKKITLIKDKLIEKIHMIREKLKGKKYPVKPVTETYVQDSSFLFSDGASKSTVPVQYSTAGPAVTIMHNTASPTPPLQESIDVRMSTPGPQSVDVKPPPPLHRIYYYPVPYPVQWPNNNNCPPLTRQPNYPTDGYKVYTDYNARPATIENTPYPNQKLPYGYGFGYGNTIQSSPYAYWPAARYPYDVPKTAYYPNAVPARPEQSLSPASVDVSAYSTSTARPIAVYQAESGPSSPTYQNENEPKNVDQYVQLEEDSRPTLDGNVVGVSVYPSRGDIAYESPKERRHAESDGGQNSRSTPREDNVETTPSKPAENVVEEKIAQSTP